MGVRASAAHVEHIGRGVVAIFIDGRFSLGTTSVTLNDGGLASGAEMMGEMIAARSGVPTCHTCSAQSFEADESMLLACIGGAEAKAAATRFTNTSLTWFASTPPTHYSRLSTRTHCALLPNSCC